MQDFDLQTITENLRIDARGLGIPDGAAEIFINHTLKNLKKTLKSKSLITENDLNRFIAKELKKYHADFAYVYQNRDTII